LLFPPTSLPPAQSRPKKALLAPFQKKNADQITRVMDQINPLTQFFKAIEKDQRISITPIGIFAALLQFRTNKGNINPIKAYRHEIMKTAKTTGPATYHR